MADKMDDDPQFRVHKELEDKDSVEHTEPFGSPLVGEPPRHWVQFDTGITEVSESFQKWMRQNDLVMMNARIVTEAGDQHLVVELQHLSEL